MSQDDQTDPDRAAILARRRRFIALAISGMATGGCKTPPQPCLNVHEPERDSSAGEPDTTEPTADSPEPIVEDPGEPVDGGTEDTGDTEGGDTGEPPPEPNPQPCLKMRPKPQPCLMIMK